MKKFFILMTLQIANLLSIESDLNIGKQNLTQALENIVVKLNSEKNKNSTNASKKDNLSKDIIGLSVRIKSLQDKQQHTTNSLNGIPALLTQVAQDCIAAEGVVNDAFMAIWEYQILLEGDAKKKNNKQEFEEQNNKKEYNNSPKNIVEQLKNLQIDLQNQINSAEGDKKKNAYNQLKYKLEACINAVQAGSADNQTLYECLESLSNNCAGIADSVNKILFSIGESESLKAAARAAAAEEEVYGQPQNNAMDTAIQNVRDAFELYKNKEDEGFKKLSQIPDIQKILKRLKLKFHPDKHQYDREYCLGVSKMLNNFGDMQK